MLDSAYFALFLVGLLGGAHCVGMCGGIVGALSMGGGGRGLLHLAYNAGRIASYAAAGAFAGALGGAGASLAGALPAQLVLFVFANLMLMALGLYLLGATRALAAIERAGRRLWVHVQPLGRRFLPARSVAQAFPLGLVWGWLPCGLVYSALATALASGSAFNGAVSMLAFGAGTLPNLLLAGLLAGRLNVFLARPVVRWIAGLIVLGMGARGLYAAVHLLGTMA